MASNQSALPLELQRLIIENLNLPKPLFRPVYGTVFRNRDTELMGNLDEKYRLYWGPPRTVEQNDSVVTLLNLFQAGSFHEEFLAPIVYETLVLRPTMASLAFIKSVQSSPRWSLVKHLIVCSVYKEAYNLDEDAEILGKAEDLDDYRRLVSDAERGGLTHDEWVEIEEKLVPPVPGHAQTVLRQHAKRKDIEEGPILAPVHAALSSNNTRVAVGQSASADAGEFQYDYDPTRNIDYGSLSTILRNLPPNLETLTIDSPTWWLDCSQAAENMIDIGFWTYETGDDHSVEMKQHVLRKQIYTILAAVCCQNNVEVLQERSRNGLQFKLQLLNTIPLSCFMFPGLPRLSTIRRTKYTTDEIMELEGRLQQEMPHQDMTDADTHLHKLLEVVTSFEISLCSWSANWDCYRMASFPCIPFFAASLPTFLFNHLSDKCNDFVFDGDETWVLGGYRAGFTHMNPLPLDTRGHRIPADERIGKIFHMPGFDKESCSAVKNVKISNIFVGRELLNFIEARTMTIQRIKLHNCWIHHSRSVSNDTEWVTSWGQFLKAMAAIVGEKLISVEISYGAKMSTIFEFDYQGEYVISTEMESESFTGLKESKSVMFGSGEIDDEYGFLSTFRYSPGESETVDDWDGWFELVQAVQANKRKFSSGG